MKTYRIAAALAATALSGAFLTVRAPGQPAAAARNGQITRIGEFNIQGAAESEVYLDPNGNRYTYDASGPKVVIKSALYEMAAPHIQLTVRRAKAGAPFRASNAQATGGVRLVITQRGAAKQTTVVTCNNATYTASAPPAVGRIDLKGNVRQVTYDPSFVEPLVQTANTGFIELLGQSRTRIKLFNPTLRVTPRESALKKPAPKGNGR